MFSVQKKIKITALYVDWYTVPLFLWYDTAINSIIKDRFDLTLEEYIRFIELEMDFLEKRNNRIEEYCKKNGLA